MKGKYDHLVEVCLNFSNGLDDVACFFERCQVGCLQESGLEISDTVCKWRLMMALLLILDAQPGCSWRLYLSAHVRHCRWQAALNWSDPTATAVCVTALVLLGTASAIFGFPTLLFAILCIMVRAAWHPAQSGEPCTPCFVPSI